MFPRDDFYRAGEASRIVEARYRLTTTAASDRTAAKRPTDAEQEKTARRGHAEPVRTTLRRQGRTAAAGATTIADFLERLSGCAGTECWSASGTASATRTRSPATQWLLRTRSTPRASRSTTAVAGWPPT